MRDLQDPLSISKDYRIRHNETDKITLTAMAGI
jgi:hypothetical protein